MVYYPPTQTNITESSPNQTVTYEPKNWEPNFTLHAFFFLVPITMLLHNRELTKTYKIKERPLVIVMKIMLFLVFYVMTLVAYFLQQSGVILIAHVMFIGVGFFALIYTYFMFSKFRFCCVQNPESGGRSFSRQQMNVIMNE